MEWLSDTANTLEIYFQNESYKYIIFSPLFDFFSLARKDLTIYDINNFQLNKCSFALRKLYNTFMKSFSIIIIQLYGWIQ